MIYQMYW